LNYYQYYLNKWFLFKEQKTVNNEIQILINLLGEKSNLKLKYEEDFLSELKIQSNTNSKSIQNSKKISELTIQIKDRVYIYIYKNNIVH
jgi:hypothetical protein